MYPFYFDFRINKSCSFFQGANYRDLPGVLVGPDNKAKRDPDVEKELLPSKKPLVSISKPCTYIRFSSHKPLHSYILPLGLSQIKDNMNLKKVGLHGKRVHK